MLLVHGKALDEVLESFLTTLLTKVLAQVKAKATVDEGAACNGVNVGVVIGVELVEVVAREVPQLDEDSLLVQWCERGRFMVDRAEEGASQSVVLRKALHGQSF